MAQQDDMAVGASRHGAQRVLRAVLEVLLLWAALTALLVLMYELIDRLFLERLPAESRTAAGLLRGIAISLTASVATALYVLFRHVPSLRVTLGAKSLPRSGTLGLPGASEARLALWLLWLRWVAVVAVAGVVVATTTGNLYVARAAVTPLWAGLVVLMVFNGALSLLRAATLASQSMLVLQISMDVAVIAWMIHHAGGLANPFAGFFVFNAVIAAIVLEPPLAQRVVGALTALLLVLAAAEATGLLPPLCLHDLGGSCAASHPLHLAATGVGVAMLVYGCPLFVLSLVKSLRHERRLLATAHTAVVEEREKLRSIIDCMGDVVLFADKEGAVKLHNQAALALWPAGMPAAHSLHVCHTAAAWQHLLAKIAAPERLEEHPLLVAHGRSYEATYAPVHGADGRLAGVVMIARDVTERLRQQQVRMRHERLAVVGRLAGSLAHEINNPLSAILLFTQHAQKQLTEGSALHTQLGTVRRNADVCVKIVRDLLRYARQRDPERRQTDLKELLADAARTLGYQATRSGVEVSLECDTEKTVCAHCDRDQLLQVLLNIGLNGIEAMDAGGKLCLRLLAENPDEIRMQISDTGSGIPPEQRDRIWEAFYTTKSEGTGLGLPVAKGLVEAQGGRIELESELGVGTTFTLVLLRHGTRTQLFEAHDSPPPPAPGQEVPL
jgi:signal transduction histidine kinase